MRSEYSPKALEKFVKFFSEGKRDVNFCVKITHNNYSCWVAEVHSRPQAIRMIYPITSSVGDIL
jgi:hypothetical protein